MNVRVNCIVPDWIATERGKRELAEMNDQARAAAPAQVELSEIADAMVRFIEDDQLSGRVSVLWGGEPARLINPNRPDWDKT
jgi:3-oxoacyl-[acyl-carrier protein] reductase